MSTVVTKNVQVGTSGTAAQNFTLYQPAAPDGTVRLANGNSGTTTDLVTVTSAGNVGIGTASPSTYGQVAIYRNTTDGTNANVAAVNAGTTGSYAGFQATAGTVNWQVFSDAAGNAVGTPAAMIRTISNHPLLFGTNNTERARIDTSGMFLPGANATYDLGSSSLRWRNVYTNDLHLSNQGGKNSVDGTWGDWTIQEGETDLYLLNNRSGKRYKFALTEVPQE